MRKVLLVFLDGVGIGDDAEYNPFMHASTPVLRAMMGGTASLLALDATLGVEGTPQSGTGQATLFTGLNAAAMHGRHFGPWVPSALRDALRNGSILARAVDAGRRVAFANAYPRHLIDAATQEPRARRLPAFLNAGPPLAAAGANVFTCDAESLRRHEAVSSEITNDGWRSYLGHTDLPIVTAPEAGSTLAAIANRNDLTLFAHYATDTAGHTRKLADGVRAIELVDAFLGGIINGIADDVMLVVASDHGNIEDIRTGHTRNPALGLLYGRDHATLGEGVTSLMSVAPLIGRMLDIA